MGTVTEKITEIVREEISGINLLKNGLIVAVSGGPDSVFLLDVLFKINKLHNLGMDLIVGHVNHSLRPSADEDEKFVSKLADKYGLKVITKKINVAVEAKKRNQTIEETGRNIRYEVLREFAEKSGVKYIATAHTRDDQRETVLLRILRGTGIRGLRGILPIRKIFADSDVNIIRPILCLSKKQIELYLQENNLKFRIDETNFDTRYYRNFIRIEILPKIEKNYPALLESLDNIVSSTQKFYALLKPALQDFRNGVLVREDNEKVVVNVERFSNIPYPFNLFFLDEVVRDFTDEKHGVLKSMWQKLQELLSSSTRIRKIYCRGGLEFTKKDNILILSRRNVEVSGKRLNPEIKINIPGETEIPDGKGKIITQLIKADSLNLDAFLKTKNKDTEIFDWNGLKKRNLTLRFRKVGDVFHPYGFAKQTKLKKFFINQKVPQIEKDNIPIILSDEEIIWVVGMRRSNLFLVTGSSQDILMISYIRCSVKIN